SGTGASRARVMLSVGGDRREAAAFGGANGSADLVVPVMHQGEELGALEVTMPANDPLDPSREKLVNDLAAQAGPVLRNVRLIEELRASRQRLVAAQDEERRKIERNLHDGAQQQLVALAVELRLLEQSAGKDPERDRQLAARLGSQANAALEDLRDLARGVYPPLLADKGLAAALEAQSRKAAVSRSRSVTTEQGSTWSEHVTVRASRAWPTGWMRSGARSRCEAFPARARPSADGCRSRKARPIHDPEASAQAASRRSGPNTT